MFEVLMTSLVLDNWAQVIKWTFKLLHKYDKKLHCRCSNIQGNYAVIKTVCKSLKLSGLPSGLN